MAKPATPPGKSNKAPSSISLSSNTVAENSASGTQIGILKVADPDKGDTFSFALSDARFELVPTPKGDYALKLVAGAAIDFEATPSIPLSITVTDSGGLTKTQAFAIGVTNVNEAPGSIALANSTVTENVAGAVIGELSALDPEGNLITYSLTDARFEIAQNEAGEWRVLKLKAGESLDYEANAEHSYAIDVTASDGSLSSTQGLQIAIANDTGDDPSTGPTWTNLTAGAPSGTYSNSTYISADGQSVALYSSAQLTAGDTDSDQDVYLWNATSGLTLLTPGDAPGSSYATAFSADGQSVLIRSIVRLTSDSFDEDVYLWNATSGLTLLTPGDAPGSSQSTAISADGQSVALYSRAQLTAGDTDSDWDTYLWNATSGLALLTPGNAPGSSYASAISADGQSVALYSTAQLTAGDTDRDTDAYLWNATSGLTLLTPGDAPGSSFASAISADGQSVLIQSSARLTAGDTDDSHDAYFWNATNGLTLLTPGDAPGSSFASAISADGQSVALYSTAQLTAGDTDRDTDAYLWDATSGLTLLTPGDALGSSHPTAISADGQSVALYSSAQLTAGDTDSDYDAYLWNATSGLALLEPPLADGASSNYLGGLSADGSEVIVDVYNAADGRSDVYLFQV